MGRQREDEVTTISRDLIPQWEKCLGRDKYLWKSDQNKKNRKTKDIFPKQRADRLGDEMF